MNGNTIDKDNNDPIVIFGRWFALAKEKIAKDPNACSLATASKDGSPSVRIVLLKHFDERGFCFFTNKTSFKGKHLLENNKAALCFYWPELDKQVRIHGEIEEVSPHEADEYYLSRSRESRIGAWASRQSSVIENEGDLQKRYDELTLKFKDDNIPRPPFWTGYRIIPQTIEFWIAKPHRLHDRTLFTKSGTKWTNQKLYP